VKEREVIEVLNTGSNGLTKAILILINASCSEFSFDPASFLWISWQTLNKKEMTVITP
jgi:hypothetical protein